MPRPYPYYPAKASTGKLPGTEKLVELCGRRWKTKNLGTWVVRDMRGKPGIISNHARGLATDVSYRWQAQAKKGKQDGRKVSLEYLNKLLQNQTHKNITKTATQKPS